MTTALNDTRSADARGSGLNIYIALVSDGLKQIYREFNEQIPPLLRCSSKRSHSYSVRLNHPGYINA